MLKLEIENLKEIQYNCNECKKPITNYSIKVIENMILYRHGYTTRKKFDEEKLCFECFSKKYPELIEMHGDRESFHKYFKEKQEEKFNNLSEEEKKKHSNLNLWKKEQNERKDVVILDSSNKGRKHFIDKFTFVTDYYLSNILSSAFESGIYGCGIWCRIVKKIRPIALDFRQDMENIYPQIDYIINGGSIFLWEFEEYEEENEKKWHELTLEKLIQGFTKYYEYVLSKFDEESYQYKCVHEQKDCDGDIADNIIQFAIFDHIVFC